MMIGGWKSSSTLYEACFATAVTNRYPGETVSLVSGMQVHSQEVVAITSMSDARG